MSYGIVFKHSTAVPAWGLWRRLQAWQIKIYEIAWVYKGPEDAHSETTFENPGYIPGAEFCFSLRVDHSQAL